MLQGLAASATKAALAAQAAAEARAEVHKIWQNQVFPAVRNSKLEELKTPIIESTFTSNGRGRQILACFRNISSKILTNVTVTLDMKDVSKSLSQRAYFIRSWPSDVIIHADPFTRIAAPTEIVGNLPPTVMSGSFETWSDQGHVASANVTPVGYYDMRNAFVDTIVYEGARYAHLDKKSQMVLEFTKVATQGNDRKVSATLIRPREGTSEKVDVTRYEGVWETRPTQKSNLRNVYGLQLTLTELGAAPLPEKNVRIPGMSGRNVRPGQKPPAPKYPSIDFRWTEKGYSVDFNKDGSFAVLPISDALTK